MIDLPPPQILLQLSLNGALGGAMYGVAAVGLSLIFGTMRLIFLAQGAMIILAAYFVRGLFQNFGIDPFLSLVIVVPVGLAAGFDKNAEVVDAMLNQAFTETGDEFAEVRVAQRGSADGQHDTDAPAADGKKLPRSDG